MCDAANQRMHIFDATVMPPKQVANIEVRDDPGWITFSIDGKYAYPSTGQVIDVVRGHLAQHFAEMRQSMREFPARPTLRFERELVAAGVKTPAQWERLMATESEERVAAGLATLQADASLVELLNG